MPDSKPIPFDDTQPYLDRRTLEEINAKFERGALRMAKLEAQVSSLQGSVDENTALTRRIDINTAGIVEWMGNLEGAFQLLNSLGRLAKPLGYIGGAVAAFGAAWAALKTGILPK